MLTPAVVWRSLRHPSPVVEVRLFALRSLAVGNVGTLLFATAFYAMVLCHVLFLVSVWRYSVLEAGLAMTPAPLCAALAELTDGVYSLGSALNSMFRQIGAVLGVAVLVAIVGTPAPADAPAAFDDGWMFSGVAGASAALAGLALGRVRAPAAAPATAEVSPL